MRFARASRRARVVRGGRRCRTVSRAGSYVSANSRGSFVPRSTWDSLKANRGARIGNWGPFVDLMVEVASEWTQGRLRRALATVLAADQALKETRISTEEGVLTDLVLQIAARMPAEGAA